MIFQSLDFESGTPETLRRIGRIQAWFGSAARKERASRARIAAAKDQIFERMG